MKREMKRRDLIMKKNDIIKYLMHNNYGVLSTVSESNIPYGVPMNYVYYDNFIYLHCMPEGHKIDNIRNHVNVCFSIICKSESSSNDSFMQPASIIAFGKIAIVKEDTEKKKALQLITEKSASDDNEESTNIDLTDNICILKIQIADMTGKMPL